MAEEKKKKKTPKAAETQTKVSEITCDFSAGDRVQRTEVSGPAGTVKNVRIETLRHSIKAESLAPPGITVTVLWDNGTTSHFVPEGLSKI